MNFCHDQIASFSMPNCRTALSAILASALLLSSCQPPELTTKPPAFDPVTVSDATPVRVLLAGITPDRRGETQPVADDSLIEAGRELAASGRLPGSPSPRLSSYFYCLDCHDTGSTPSSLPAPSFAGVTNRVTWFQSDMADTYAPPEEVRHSIEKAVQFCSTNVAGGKALEDPEMEAMLAYLRSLEINVGDLGFRGADLAELKRRAINPDEHAAIAEEVQSRYPIRLTRTRGDLPEDTSKGYRISDAPDPEIGSRIWSQTCLHCHDADGASVHYFGERKTTWETLEQSFNTGELYRRIREGTHPSSEAGHMPAFSTETLSDARIEHLRAFIRSRLDDSSP